jgi:hypothetical protein
VLLNEQDVLSSTINAREAIAVICRALTFIG